MPDLNLGRISAKVADMRENAAILRRYGALPDEAFLSNVESVGAAKYAFVVMIEASVNLASHLCAKSLSKAPVSQRDSFLMLGEAGLLPADLAERLGKMASFRNVLVHGYAEVDNKAMLAIMREDLPDVDLFITRVLELSEGTTGA